MSEKVCWEYKWIETSEAKELGTYGKEGWEVATVAMGMFLLKRQYVKD